MPKVTLPSLPISSLFGMYKPSGPTSMAVINDLKRLVSASRLFIQEDIASENAEKLYRSKQEGVENKEDKGRRRKKRGGRVLEAKMGQGGTLDPLADGVLVIGVNKGTKKLGDFLDCVKEYRTTCLLGCETDSYDAEGTIVRTAPWHHISREKVEAILEQFRGEIQQTPPVFSALKMDGRPLYEYARSGDPLPRPIEKRTVTVHSLKLTHWIPGSEHSFNYPEKKFTDEEREKMERALRGKQIPEDAQIKDEPETSISDRADVSTEVESEGGTLRPPAFVLSMQVSGGTYVRSIAHDIGHALGSAAHVVTLTRSQQGRFKLPSTLETKTPLLDSTKSNTNEPINSEAELTGDNTTSNVEQRICLPWSVFENALEKGWEEKPDEDGWREWERKVMEVMEIIP